MNSSDEQHALGARAHVPIDADSLLKEVLRSRREFRSEIFRTVAVEVGTLLLAVPVWLYLGFERSWSWTWYLSAAALVWLGASRLAYRMLHQRKIRQLGEAIPHEAKNTLIHNVRIALAEVEDEIRLQHVGFWWAQLPFFVSILISVAFQEWLIPREDWSDFLDDVGSFVAITAIWAFVVVVAYLVTRYAAISKLKPRRKELLTLLDRLQDGTVGGN